jgi:hypothetical protein
VQACEAGAAEALEGKAAAGTSESTNAMSRNIDTACNFGFIAFSSGRSTY